MVLSITSLTLSRRVGILRRIRKIKRDIRDPLIAFYKFAPFCHEWITAALHDAAPQKKENFIGFNVYRNRLPKLPRDATWMAQVQS